MYLPNRYLAVIPKAKIYNYLLDLSSKEGVSKARFFLSFGFQRHAWEELAEALKLHAILHEAKLVVRPSQFGVKYETVGRITTPDERNPVVRVVWIVPYGWDRPRLVTAIPVTDIPE